MFRGFSSSSLKRHKKYIESIYFLELRDIYFPVSQTGILFQGDCNWNESGWHINRYKLE